jgi:hypothetical protein
MKNQPSQPRPLQCLSQSRSQAGCPRRGHARDGRARPLLAPACAGLLALGAAVALAGCANFQAWGQKTSGSPATMGGAFNIPLGK